MVRRLCLMVVLLAVLTVFVNGAQAQQLPVQQPQGELFQRADGSFGYIVSTNDRVGQWQVAFGSPRLWTELVNVNPQLADPDKIWPGNELNVPPSLVRLFAIMKAADKVGDVDYAWNPPQIPGVGSADKTTVPPVVVSSGIPWWAWALLVLLAIALFLLLLQRSKLGWERRSNRTYREQIDSAALRDAERREQERMADPYSGPPVRENGLPSSEAAEAFFAEAYRSEREGMTVARSNALPPSIVIDRIVPVDVRGPMMVNFANGPQQRNVERWTPAWQCFLSDGTFRIALMACANDVRAGHGGQALPGTQIRPRQDVPERIVQRQIWPEIAPSSVPAEIPTAISPLQFASVRFDGPMRLVFHPGGQVLDLGPLVAQGVRISVGVQNGEVIVDNNGQRVVFGRIVGEQPAQPVPAALPAGTSEETARQVEEILARVPADDSDHPIVTEAATSVPSGNG
jgi:hypothetical protein